jgi:uncharacterized protein involved in type VI secretion and phage assembly
MNVVELLAQSQGRDAVVGKTYGAVVGVVTSIDDPDGLGRVKVAYPWLQDDAESPWARTVTFMAGNGRGAVFRPDVGDEVLVVCEHGDMRRPYVVGALWNGRDAIPSERGADADNAIRLIKSRSGHTIVLDDTDGAETVTISDKHGNTVELSSEGVTVRSDAVHIGSASSSEGLVLGDAFMQLFNQHTHPTGVGPSGPPTQPMVSGNHVSTKHKTE